MVGSVTDTDAASLQHDLGCPECGEDEYLTLVCFAGEPKRCHRRALAARLHETM